MFFWGWFFCWFGVTELFLPYFPLFTHLSSVSVLQQVGFAQRVFLCLTEMLSSPVKATPRSTGGKQQAGQREQEGWARRLCLPAPAFSFTCSLLMLFPFSSEMPISVIAASVLRGDAAVRTAGWNGARR